MRFRGRRCSVPGPLPGGYRLSGVAPSFALRRFTVDVGLLSRCAGSHTLAPFVHTVQPLAFALRGRAFAFVRALAISDLWSDRSPYAAVPNSPVTGPGRVPHHLRSRRPGRLRWLRRSPWRRRSPGPPPRRGGRAARTLPVVALIPVPVRDVAPGRVPWITRAPVTGGWRGWGRTGDGAAGHTQSRQRQRAARHHARRPPHHPLYSRHLLRISLDEDPGKWQSGFVRKSSGEVGGRPLAMSRRNSRHAVTLRTWPAPLRSPE